MMKTLYAICLALALFAVPAHGVVSHVQSAAGFMSSGTANANFTGTCTTGSTTCTYSFTATTTSDPVFFSLTCACASTTNVIGLTAPSWTINVIPCTGATNCTSGTYGTSGNRVASFWAFAPNTSAATFSAAWGAAPGGFANDLVDEFAGTDAVNPVDASSAIAGTGNCSASVTPTVANDGLWGACTDTVTAVGGSYTKGADDTSTDWTEWKILSGGSGTPQTVNFTGSGTFEMIAVAIKPASVTLSTGSIHTGKYILGGKAITN